MYAWPWQKYTPLVSRTRVQIYVKIHLDLFHIHVTHTHPPSPSLDPPKADDTISATPFNRTSILVAWSPAPDFARDPLLLRYTLFYTDDAPESPLNTSTANSRPDLPPLLRNGSVSRNGILEYVLSGLEIGTEYWLSVRTSYLELEGEESEVFAFSSTYGNGTQPCAYIYMYLRVRFISSLISKPAWQVCQCHTYNYMKLECNGLI